MHDTLWRDLGTHLKGVKGIKLHCMTSDIFVLAGGAGFWVYKVLTCQEKHDTEILYK